MGSELDWPAQIYGVLKESGVQQVSYVPDAGHARLLELPRADPDVHTIVLATEEEGVALGAWMGGQRAVLLMQSSGVGRAVEIPNRSAAAHEFDGLAGAVLGEHHARALAQARSIEPRASRRCSRWQPP